MSWKQFSRLDNVYSGLKIFKNLVVYYDDKHRLLVRNNETYEILKIFSFDQDYIYKVLDTRLLFSINNKLSKIELHDFQFEDVYVSDKQYIEPIDQHCYVASSYHRKDKKYSSQLISDQRILWELHGDIGFRDSFDDILIFSDRLSQKIVRINFVSGEKEWEFDFKDKISRQIQVLKNLLITILETNKVVCLDIRIGLKLWELSNCLYYYNLDIESGLLYGYSRDKYEVIDPKNGNVLITKKFEEAEERYRISPQAHMNTLSGDGIYFMSNWYEPRFGKININTNEIEFVQELEVEEGVKGDIPVYHNGRLYIRDSMNTLHIFEEN